MMKLEGEVTTSAPPSPNTTGALYLSLLPMESLQREREKEREKERERERETDRRDGAKGRARGRERGGFSERLEDVFDCAKEQAGPGGSQPTFTPTGIGGSSLIIH